MELLISGENLPKFAGMKPNTIAILYLDNNTLETSKKHFLEKSQTYLSSDKLNIDGASETENKASRSRSRIKKEREPVWVEKLRTEVIFGSSEPIYLDSYTFNAPNY